MSRQHQRIWGVLYRIKLAKPTFSGFPAVVKNEAGVASLGVGLDAGDDALRPAPTPRGVAELHETAHFAAGRCHLEVFDRALLQRRDMAGEGRIGSQANDPIHPVRPAPVEDFQGPVMAAARVTRRIVGMLRS
jgi:hypothetical protein